MPQEFGYANHKAVISPPGPSTKQFVHPNHPWINGNLNLSNHPKGFNPTQTIKDNQDKIFNVKKCIVSLLILYQDGKTRFSSAFRVAPRIYLTTKRNLFPSERTDEMVQALYVSSIINTKEVYYMDEVDLEKFGYIVCKIISTNDHKILRQGKDLLSNEQTKDIDPLSGLKLDITADFLFIESMENVGFEDSFMLPYWKHVEEHSHMAVTGYNMPIDTRYLQRMYGDDELSVISERKLEKVFFGYCLEGLSPGFIGKKNDHLFTHSCSTTLGSSGSACIVLDRFHKATDITYPFFIGVHVGSWAKLKVENNNYNLALSINHPLFMEAYKQFVLPKLPESLRGQFKY